MSWEAATAIGTLLTSAIIAASAIIAIYQIRHLRAAAQLESFLSLMAEATGPELAVWTDYAETVLPEKMKDDVYRGELESGKYDFQTHPELRLGAFWEKIGTLVHYRQLDSNALIDFVSNICPHHWMLLRDVAMLRRRSNPHIWERFEELAQRCEAHMRSCGATPPSER